MRYDLIDQCVEWSVRVLQAVRATHPPPASAVLQPGSAARIVHSDPFGTQVMVKPEPKVVQSQAAFA